ncbi:uncharacterized protein LOC105186194 isoform X5 [Harpegnathos saltator]|uniref:uncharacterized protein LOC105186194 isoform X5 n=1 Tax=Harpegnathos saltator TaxID=610380 RepID=UPI00058D9536|nr:uncharacterized protein LOC105186194 isoform X5 [Harpegnathos saltator]
MSCIDETDDKDAAFKKQVLCQLQLLNFKHTQMSEDIQTILTKIAGQGDNLLLMNDEETIFHKFDFPLKNISELNSVKHYLADDNNAIMMIKEFTKIGGTTYKQTIKRMSLLFSNEVIENYSWIGFKGKNKFSLLRIAAVIIKAVQKTHGTITLCDIETAMKMWLVKAKFRNAKKAL